MFGISIIVPIKNDFTQGKLREQVELFNQINNIEVIFVDGGSSDESLDFLSEHDFKIIELPHSNRAERINKGIDEARSNFVLLHHPRSILTKDGIEELLSRRHERIWGGFTHSFDKDHYLLKFTSWYSNQVRAKIRGIYYLDHCIFFHKDLLKDITQLPTIEIFEDTALSEQLLQSTHPTLIEFPSTTSAIRFNRNGIWKQALLNQLMKICWILKISPENMNKIYEKGLDLNSKT